MPLCFRQVLGLITIHFTSFRVPVAIEARNKSCAWQPERVVRGYKLRNLMVHRGRRSSRAQEERQERGRELRLTGSTSAGGSAGQEPPWLKKEEKEEEFCEEEEGVKEGTDSKSKQQIGNRNARAWHLFRKPYQRFLRHQRRIIYRLVYSMI